MATYKALRGLTIRTVAGDISPVALGDIWYNNVSRKITIGQTAIAAWASSNNMNNARYATGAFGSQTAGAIYGGYMAPSAPTAQAFVEEYDGTSWTEVTNLPKGLNRMSGAGTQTAGITMPGSDPTSAVSTETYEYDGTNWTETGDYPAPTSRCCAAGTQTAGLGYSGYNPAGNKTGEYDGTSWTEVNNVGTARYNSTFGGLQTAALFITGGDQTPPTVALTNVEDYDGTNWTEIADINSARKELGSTIQGTPSAMAIYGGVPPGQQTEVFDGTSWTEVADIPTAKGANAGGGTAAAGLTSGGNPGIQNSTFEFTGEYVATTAVTSS